MKVNIGRYPGLRSKKSRKVDVKVDPWDTWNMDETVSFLVLPLLKQLRDNKRGVPSVDDVDVPEELHWKEGELDLLTYSDESKKAESDAAFDKLEARWAHVLDGIIEAFERIVDTEWERDYYEIGNFDALQREWDEVQRNTMLFGKYLRAMWE